MSETSRKKNPKREETQPRPQNMVTSSRLRNERHRSTRRLFVWMEAPLSSLFSIIHLPGGYRRLPGLCSVVVQPAVALWVGSPGGKHGGVL